MHNEPWNVVFLIGFIVYVTIRGVFKQRTKGNHHVVNRLDTRERILMFLVISTSVFMPVLYLFTPWLRFADYDLPGWVPWCGALVMIAALWLFWRSHADLAQNWSLTLQIREGHQLVTTGVYHHIRHPMYAAIWLFGIAQALLLENWLAGWSAFATFAIMYFLRTDREERMMCDFFGQDYRDYMEQTGRIFPRMRRPG